MYGDDRVRFCSQCNLNVYNLSSMSRDEAEVLLLRTEGRSCVRYFARKDGTVLTKDCPIGLQAILDRRRSTKSRLVRAILSLVAYTAAMITWGSLRSAQGMAEPVTGAIALPFQSAPGTYLAVTQIEEVTRIEEKNIRKRAILKVDPVCRYSCGKEQVVVRIVINQQGHVESSSCSSRNSKHRELAEEAARAWRFSPVLVGGVPVRVESTLTIVLD